MDGGLSALRRSVLVLMCAKHSIHPGSEALEEYALGRLPEETIPAFEQHLLICAGCQDRMLETDADVQAFVAEARAIRRQHNRLRGTAQSSS